MIKIISKADLTKDGFQLNKPRIIKIIINPFIFNDKVTYSVYNKGNFTKLYSTT